jgi:hypothetical protein
MDCQLTAAACSSERSYDCPSLCLPACLSLYLIFIHLHPHSIRPPGIIPPSSLQQAGQAFQWSFACGSVATVVAYSPPPTAPDNQDATAIICAPSLRPWIHLVPPATRLALAPLPAFESPRRTNRPHHHQPWVTFSPKRATLHLTHAKHPPSLLSSRHRLER